MEIDPQIRHGIGTDLSHILIPGANIVDLIKSKRLSEENHELSKPTKLEYLAIGTLETAKTISEAAILTGALYGIWKGLETLEGIYQYFN